MDANAEYFRVIVQKIDGSADWDREYDTWEELISALKLLRTVRHRKVVGVQRMIVSRDGEGTRAGKLEGWEREQIFNTLGIVDPKLVEAGV